MLKQTTIQKRVLDQYLTLSVNSISNGAEESLSDTQKENEDIEWQDPYFFDEGYTIAGTTGFLLWEGAEVMIKFLESLVKNFQTTDESSTNLKQLVDSLKGYKVIELGCGTGYAGLMMALGFGSNVLLTDLNSVVEGSAKYNLGKNATPCSCRNRKIDPSTIKMALDISTLNAETNEDTINVESNENPKNNNSDSGYQNDCVHDNCWNVDKIFHLGSGTVCTSPLDWTNPHFQLYQTSENQKIVVDDMRTADLVIGCECVWLRELVLPFVTTTIEILKGPSYFKSICAGKIIRRQKFALLSLRNRAKNESTFATDEETLKLFRDNGCMVEILHSEKSLEDPSKHSCVYRVSIPALDP